MEINGSLTDVLFIIGGQVATLVLGIVAVCGLIRYRRRQGDRRQAFGGSQTGFESGFRSVSGLLPLPVQESRH